MNWWAVFKEDIKLNHVSPLDNDIIIFEKDKRYCVQLEEDGFYFISMTPSKVICNECCKMPINQEGNLFDLVQI